MAGKILVVDDELDIRILIKEILEDENFQVAAVADASQADNILRDFNPNLILLDIWMPGMDGITLLKKWGTTRQLNIPVIMMSGHGTIETAVEATRLGAYDFIEKPLSIAKLLLTVKHALENVSLKKENVRLREYNEHIGVPIGKSRTMQMLRTQISQIAKHSAPVLISGKPGTDKELFARYLHDQSPRAGESFINVSISALSSGNSITEFFGSDEPGNKSPGFFEEAESGTLFLKDIADMDLSLQAKLQDTLSNAYFIRPGTTQKKSFDIRIIAGTSKDILSLVNKGQFRDDLYYQLNVLPIHIPPLRDHAEDIPELLEFYTDLFVDKEGLPYRHFSVAAQNYLRSYSWPGNIRELSNLIQRLLILGNQATIDIDELSLVLGKTPAPNHEETVITDFDMPLREAREQFEKRYLQHKLDLAEGNVSRAAKDIGMERTHLYRKLKSLGIKIKH